MSDPQKPDPLLLAKPNSVFVWPITLAICIALTICMDWNEPNFLLARQDSLSGAVIARLLGNLTGEIGGAVLLSGLLFGWRERDRKYWPFATLVVMGLAWIGR